MGYFSTGTEGKEYQHAYCERCANDVNKDCTVWLAHLLYNSIGEANPILHAVPNVSPPSGARRDEMKLFKRLKEKKYRHQFVAGEVSRTIPFQVRALRAERKWTQADLGREAEMPQTVVSRIENGDAASLSIKTLLKLATAFDVALVVRFEPIDNLIQWVDNLSPEVMAPRTSQDILAAMEPRHCTTSEIAIWMRKGLPSHCGRMIEIDNPGNKEMKGNEK